MKINPSTKIFLVLLFGQTVCFSYGQGLTSFYALTSNEKAKVVMHDNEFIRNEIGLAENIYCNPLLLDGKGLDYGVFTLRTRGELTLVKGDPGSHGSVKISFFVRLRRGGKIVDGTNMELFNKEIDAIEISKVLAMGQPGDQLIIDPARKEDWKAKRILNLIL
jgi:hypothetical protein